MFAQSLLEYGSATSFGAAMRSLGSAIFDTFSDVPQSTWLLLGGMVLALLILTNRRRSRRRF